MNYKVTNIGEDTISAELIDDTSYTSLFLKRKRVADEVIVSATGRNIRFFTPLIAYKLIDFLVEKEQRIGIPMIQIYPTDERYDTPKIVVKSLGGFIRLKTYFPRPKEHYVAILQAVDKEYASNLRIRYKPELIEPNGLKALQDALRM